MLYSTSASGAIFHERHPISHHSYFAEFLVKDTHIVSLHRAIIECDVHMMYLLNTSDQHSRLDLAAREGMHLGDLPALTPSSPGSQNTF